MTTLIAQPNAKPETVLPAPQPQEQASGGQMEFLKSQFFSLLLLVVFLALLVVMIHVLHHQSDSSVLSWLEQKDGEALAALLTLATVRASQRNGDKNGNGNGNGDTK